jgi:hypothetical protein
LVLVKGFSLRNSAPRRGLYLGVVAETAALRNGSTPLVLDHDLDVLPEQGRRLTVAALARHVDDLARRLHAAGVRFGEHLAIYKAANWPPWRP